MATYQAVIFDLDGTLVDSMWIWKDIDEAYLKGHGHTLPDDLQKDIEGMSTTETAQYFKDRFQITDTIDAIKAEWMDMARDYYAHRIPLRKGARSLIERLHQEGVKIGIGTSNFREMTELVLASHQISHLIHTIRTSCEVERGKPFPDVFLKVAEDLGVEPQACLVFEDTHAGVKAARAAGMDVIAIEDPLSLPYQEAIKEDATDYMRDFEGLTLI